MHLKNCFALLLLVLVTCHAAPATQKIIEKKSINEKTSKISNDLKLEDPSADKNRAKKSATFCVEIRTGNQIPCKDTQLDASPVNVQVVPSAPMAQPIREIPRPVTILQPSSPPAESAHIIQVPRFQPRPASQTVHVIQQEQPQPSPQTVHVIQQEQPRPSPQTVHVIQQEQPQPSPQIHVIQPQQPAPAPIKVETVQSQVDCSPPSPQVPPRRDGTWHVIHIPESQQQVVLPATQAPPQPIINILPASVPSCNQLTIQPQVTLEDDKLKLKPKPEVPKPAALPKPSKTVEILPERPIRYTQEIVVPAINSIVVPEQAVAVPTLDHFCDYHHHHELHSLTPECNCPQDLHLKINDYKMPRNHHKAHEHHMIYHNAPIGPSLAEYNYPLSLLAANNPKLPQVILDTEYAQPAIYQPMYSSEYIVEPVRLYDSYPDENRVSSVAVNTYPQVETLYRNSQRNSRESGNDSEKNLTISQINDLSIPNNQQQEDDDFVKLKDVEQKTVVTEQPMEQKIVNETTSKIHKMENMQ